MKKFLVIILAFTYLTVSSGATLDVHYCMGKMMNWDLLHKQSARCGTCGMDKLGHKGCCKDVHKVLQIEKDQKVSESGFQFFNIASDVIAVSYATLPLIHFSSIVAGNPVAHAPPRLGTVPVFILNCNFRI